MERVSGVNIKVVYLYFCRGTEAPFVLRFPFNLRIFENFLSKQPPGLIAHSSP